MMKIQEGMRIKSKDIHFVRSIFYLANKRIFDIIFFSLRFYSVVQRLYDRLFYLLAFKIKRACKYPTCKLMTT